MTQYVASSCQPRCKLTVSTFSGEFHSTDAAFSSPAQNGVKSIRQVFDSSSKWLRETPVGLGCAAAPPQS